MTVEHDIKSKIEKDDGGLEIGWRNKTQGRNDANLVCILKQPCSENDFGH